MDVEKQSPDYKRCWLALKEQSTGIVVRNDDGQLVYPVTDRMNELESKYVEGREDS
jgi:hypothetical protein